MGEIRFNTAIWFLVWILHYFVQLSGRTVISVNGWQPNRFRLTFLLLHCAVLGKTFTIICLPYQFKTIFAAISAHTAPPPLKLSNICISFSAILYYLMWTLEGPLRISECQNATGKNVFKSQLRNRLRRIKCSHLYTQWKERNHDCGMSKDALNGLPPLKHHWVQDCLQLGKIMRINSSPVYTGVLCPMILTNEDGINCVFLIWNSFCLIQKTE